MLQGPQLFQEQEPILPQIEAAVKAGLRIPFNVPPVAAAPITVTTLGSNSLEYIPMSQLA